MVRAETERRTARAFDLTKWMAFATLSEPGAVATGFFLAKKNEK